MPFLRSKKVTQSMNCNTAKTRNYSKTRNTSIKGVLAKKAPFICLYCDKHFNKYIAYFNHKKLHISKTKPSEISPIFKEKNLANIKAENEKTQINVSNNNDESNKIKKITRNSTRLNSLKSNAIQTNKNEKSSTVQDKSRNLQNMNVRLSRSSSNRSPNIDKFSSSTPKHSNRLLRNASSTGMRNNNNKRNTSVEGTLVKENNSEVSSIIKRKNLAMTKTINKKNVTNGSIRNSDPIHDTQRATQINRISLRSNTTISDKNENSPFVQDNSRNFKKFNPHLSRNSSKGLNSSLSTSDSLSASKKRSQVLAMDFSEPSKTLSRGSQKSLVSVGPPRQTRFRNKSLSLKSPSEVVKRKRVVPVINFQKQKQSSATNSMHVRSYSDRKNKDKKDLLQPLSEKSNPDKKSNSSTSAKISDLDSGNSSGWNSGSSLDKDSSNSSDNDSSNFSDKDLSNSSDKDSSNSSDKDSSNSRDKNSSNSRDKDSSNSRDKNSRDKDSSNSSDKDSSNSSDNESRNYSRILDSFKRNTNHQNNTFHKSTPILQSRIVSPRKSNTSARLVVKKPVEKYKLINDRRMSRRISDSSDNSKISNFSDLDQPDSSEPRKKRPKRSITSSYVDFFKHSRDRSSGSSSTSDHSSNVSEKNKPLPKKQKYAEIRRKQISNISVQDQSVSSERRKKRPKRSMTSSYVEFFKRSRDQSSGSSSTSDHSSNFSEKNKTLTRKLKYTEIRKKINSARQSPKLYIKSSGQPNSSKPTKQQQNISEKNIKQKDPNKNEKSNSLQKYKFRNRLDKSYVKDESTRHNNIASDLSSVFDDSDSKDKDYSDYNTKNLSKLYRISDGKSNSSIPPKIPANYREKIKMRNSEKKLVTRNADANIQKRNQKDPSKIAQNHSLEKPKFRKRVVKSYGIGKNPFAEKISMNSTGHNSRSSDLSSNLDDSDPEDYDYSDGKSSDSYEESEDSWKEIDSDAISEKASASSEDKSDEDQSDGYQSSDGSEFLSEGSDITDPSNKSMVNITSTTHYSLRKNSNSTLKPCSVRIEVGNSSPYILTGRRNCNVLITPKSKKDAGNLILKPIGTKKQGYVKSLTKNINSPKLDVLPKQTKRKVIQKQNVRSSFSLKKK